MSINFSKRVIFWVFLAGLSYFGDSFASYSSLNEEEKGLNKEISPKSREVVLLLSPFSALGIPEFYLGNNKAGWNKLGITACIAIIGQIFFPSLLPIGGQWWWGGAMIQTIVKVTPNFLRDGKGRLVI